MHIAWLVLGAHHLDYKLLQWALHVGRYLLRSSALLEEGPMQGETFCM